MKIASIALPLTLLLAPASPSVARAATPSDCSQAHRQAGEDLMDLYVEVFDSHDMSRLEEVLTPDSINENPLGTMTLEELAAAMEGFYVAFPDLDYEIEDVIVVGDQIVLEYTYTGTHLGPLMGVPPTGIVVHGRGLEVHTIDDGRIAHTRNYSDVFGLFAQLGLL